MKTLTAIAAALALAVSTTIAVAGGYFEGLPSTTDAMPLDQMTGNETIPMDTQLSQGRMPQTLALPFDAILAGKVTDDSDASAPAIAASGVAGAPLLYYRFTGAAAANQAATLPTVALTYAYLNDAGTINAFPKCWFVKFINVGGTGSGTYTITTSAGWTLAGNLVVPVAGSRTMKMCLTSATVGTATDYGS